MPCAGSASAITSPSRCPTPSSGSRPRWRAGSWARCPSRCPRICRTRSSRACWNCGHARCSSGGRTGRPKLIEVGGDSRVPPTMGYAMGWHEGDTTLVPVPLTHNTGFTTAAIALLTSNHLVLMSRFDPHEFLRLIADHRAQLVIAVPTIMQRALPVYGADPGSYDLSSVRRLWHVGAPCPPAIKEEWINLLGPV